MSSTSRAPGGMTFLQKSILGCFGLLFLLVVGGIVVFIILDSGPEPGKFKVDRFCDFSAYHEALQTPYLEGKLLFVHARSKTTDTDLAALFPRECLAVTEEEVGTIVWLEWSYENVGDYVDSVTRVKKDDAFKGKAFVSIVNQRSKEILSRSTFEGFDPAARRMAHESTMGKMPYGIISNYILNLPRK